MNGQTLSGTINDLTPCTTPRTITVTSDFWEVWNGVDAYRPEPMPTSPYSLKSDQDCTYTLI